MSQEKNAQSKQEAVEIIELAVDNLDVLTKAFQLITTACEELQNPEPRLAPPSRLSIN